MAKKTALDEPTVKPEASSNVSKNEDMEVDSTNEKEDKLEHSDDEFDKEIEEAAAEEKEAKKEKLEMMSIIHTM